jgi:FixJ family two-component response regulator
MDAACRVRHTEEMDRQEQGGAVERPLVSVVDDDESVRESLPDLLNEFGFETRAFSSAQDFLASDCVSHTECLILDIAMPGMTGFDLVQELRHRGQVIPVVFITAQTDRSFRSKAFDSNAVSLLPKPFSDTALLASVEAALLKR